MFPLPPPSFLGLSLMLKNKLHSTGAASSIQSVSFRDLFVRPFVVSMVSLEFFLVLGFSGAVDVIVSIGCGSRDWHVISGLLLVAYTLVTGYLFGLCWSQPSGKTRLPNHKPQDLRMDCS
jgi:hypothetical protein